MQDYLILASKIVPYLCTIILLVCLIIGLVEFSKKERSIQIITAFVAGSLLLDLISKSYLLFALGSNIYLFPILSLLEFLFITTYYKQAVEMSSSLKRSFAYFQFSGVAVIVGFIVWSLLFSSFDAVVEVSSNLKIGVHLVIIVLVLHLMINQFAKVSVSVITYGMLMYYAGSIIIFLLLPNLINTSLTLTYVIWLINALLLLGFYFTCFLELKRWKESS